jgi:arachidonate 12-lipoxygenase (R-type)
LTIGHGSDGILQLIAKSMQEFRFDIHWDYEKGVNERDVWDLPNYFARDDALALWKTFKKYVTGVIDIFYLDDNDVKEDVELAMWMKDITR